MCRPILVLTQKRVFFYNLEDFEDVSLCVFDEYLGIDNAYIQPTNSQWRQEKSFTKTSALSTSGCTFVS
jgi:hypothetical protein